MSQTLDITPDYYDLLVDWPKRLAHEGPFYRRVFEDLGARRVLDAACGTGQHLILFRQWGLDCTGSDADPAMIEQAKANAAGATPKLGLGVSDGALQNPLTRSGGGTPRPIEFFVARFAELPAHVREPFDAVLCVGNSFSMVAEGEAGASMAGLSAAVRPGGVLILHVLNALQFAERRLRFLPLRVRKRQGRTVLIQKMYEPREDGLGVHFLFIEEQADGSWRSAAESNVIANRSPAAMTALLAAAGFARIEQYGDYHRGPLTPESTDLIVIARR